MRELTSPISVFDHADLQKWAERALLASGLGKGDAAATARVLVRTNLRGIDTHGVARLSAYVEKVRSGEVNRSPTVRQQFEAGTLRVDGDGAIGQALLSGVVDAAVKHAHDYPVVTTLIRGSGHLAALGQFVLEAAERGMVALLCQETPPLMALPGAKRPAIGNNPIAFSAPVKDRAPLVFDMATSVVARGNVLQAIRDNRTDIPETWALGPDGQPTRDPKLALKGAMRPVADHKGIGLAMIVQVLAGCLNVSQTAASAARHGAQSSAGNVSAFLLVLNPALLIGQALFDQQMLEWVSVYNDANGDTGRYPGARAAECEQQRRTHGIPVANSIVDELRQVGHLVGEPFDLMTVPHNGSCSDAENPASRS